MAMAYKSYVMNIIVEKDQQIEEENEKKWAFEETG